MSNIQRANQLKPQQVALCDSTVAWLQANQVHELVSDARKVAAGDAFVAYAFDAKNDGRAYIEQAQKNHAAIVWQDDGAAIECGSLNLGVPQLNVLAGHIAHRFYAQASQQMDMIAVTGTNGKTSCAQWIAQLLTQLDKKCALMGTLGVGFVDAMVETGFTTPQAIEVHRLLRGLVTQDAQATVMEVSSHALEQGRVNGVVFDVALFTNISRDHLDYHGDMASYEAAKARLFTWQDLKAAVINMDDPAGVRMSQIAKANGIDVIGYGFAEQAAGVDVYLQASEMVALGAQTQFVLRTSSEQFVIKSALVGAFNVLNLLGVLGTLLALGFDLSKTAPLCAHISAAPGRMQRFGGEQQPLAVVDFAHTPDALEKTLRALAPIAEQRGGQLICVFGCGGDRDPGKRPQMGQLAAQWADCVWITSDNPRSENPQQIVDEIAQGAQGRAQIKQEVERRLAIAQAIKQASASDVVLVAGKGHEAYQEIKGIKYPYSDLNEVQTALNQWTRPV